MKLPFFGPPSHIVRTSNMFAEEGRTLRPFAFLEKKLPAPPPIPSPRRPIEFESEKNQEFINAIIHKIKTNYS